uniref:Serpentine Receptor, class H n=1 Tax=Panagrellus redivivus TaxID=6233 RepID=A0A7E4V1D2_PANRE
MSAALVDLSSYFYDNNEFTFFLIAFDFALAMFLSYVIITKSKHLGSYKYFLLNQNISGVLLSMVLVLGRPVALAPYYCIFMAGPLRLFAGTTTTIILASSAILYFLNAISIIVVSIINRYIHMFHSTYTYVFQKWYLFILINILFNFLFTLAFLFAIRDSFASHETIVAIAMNETDGALVKFYNEPTLMCFSTAGTKIDKVAQGITVTIIFLAIVLISMTSAFVLAVKRLKTVCISKLSRSLYISVIVQSILLILIIFMPTAVFGIMYSLKFTSSANFASFLISFASFHGTVDTLSMLYFIVPYRKYCLSLFCRKKSRVASEDQKS